MLAALQRIGINIEQGKDAGDRAFDALGEELGVVKNLKGRRLKGTENGNGDAGVASRSVDRNIDRILEPLNALTVLSPLAETLVPERGLPGGQLVRGEPRLRRIIIVRSKEEA